MNMRNTIHTGVALLFGSAMLAQAAEITVPRIIESDTTWTADNTYFLEGYTFVVTPEGAGDPTVLTIEPGTVVMGAETTGSNAAALVITRGARIMAEGTASDPIIFTSELDDLNGNLGIEDTNLWGGVIILGNASISSRADSEIVASPVEDQVEGLDTSGEESDYATFGGTDDDDNSGVLRYVSIRHGGAVIGGDNEINGLTLGGVGRGTTVEYIEVFANKDDSIEWFGGTVDARYLVSAFGNDDSFDYDQGWRGKGQFWFTIGSDIGTDRMDKGGEHDGATAPVDAEPLSDTTVYNATFIGIGPDGGGNTAFNIRDNASARYYNSIFMDFEKMMDIEDDNQIRFDSGDAIDFRSNIWFSHVAANNTPEGFNARPGGAVDSTVFWTDAAYNNLIQDPLLRGVSRQADGGLDPRPSAESPALSIELQPVPEDDFYVQTNYAGAFGPEGNWAAGWTKLSRDGYLAEATGEELYLGTWERIEQDYVDTGDWLGLLYIGLHPWIYSYETGGYFYLAEESFGDPGGWIYAPRYGDSTE